MKKLLLISIVLMLAGCVAVPVYDSGYYYPDYYAPYPYGYVGPEVNVFFSGNHGGHGFRGDHGFNHGDHGFRGGGHGFHGGGHWGGGRR